MPAADGRPRSQLVDCAAVTSARSTPVWALPLLLLAGLTILYWGPLNARFLNDDYVFLEQARSQPLAHSLTALDALGNYYRPVSRQLYFATWGTVSGGAPWVFHAVNYALLLGSLALLAELLLAVLPLAGAVAGVLYFALLPFQRVVLLWISCSQDLLALAGTLATLALYRRGRIGWALGSCGIALASKESALPMVAALVAWDRLIDRRDWRAITRRAAPFAALTLAWTTLSMTMRGPRPASPLIWTANAFAAGYAHLAQSLLGIEHPKGMFAALMHNPPAILPLIVLLPIALLCARDATRPERHPPRGAPGQAQRSEPGGAVTPARAIAGFAAVWLVAFAAIVGPVAHSWSAYYYTLAAVGGAFGVGLLMRHARAPGLSVLILGLLWLHAGSSATRAFAVDATPWTWTSHLTSSYFERAAALTDTMSAQLQRLEPDPPADARFFFATLPPYAGFQTGNGALVRSLYRRPGIQSYFLSQFSDSTAGRHPARFLYWDGAQLVPLYPANTDVFFQVGSDLLLLDRVEHALHAFRRGVTAGETPNDLLYWIGWGELWSGRRLAAERAWTELGFADDSLRWIAHLRAAHNALVDGDTLESRRHLITAIQYGVGRPEAHAVLGELLTGRNAKYGLLELKVATGLNPHDWVARRALAVGLAAVKLNDQAQRELVTLLSQQPALRSDPAVVRLQRELQQRVLSPETVFEFP